MVKKILLILVFMLLVTFFGCNMVDSNIVGNSSTAMITNDDSGLANFKTGALKCEENYLASKSDEDLKKLCSQLSILPWDEKQLREMVLDYYPIFFEKFSEEQISDISERGFDPFYEEYVFAYKAESKGGLIPIYNEYKEKAYNKYIFARAVYDYVLRLDNLSDDEYTFLYKEAYDLYAEARENAKEVYITENENREAFLKVLGAYGCVIEICDVLKKEIDSNIQDDMEEYKKNYKKLIDSYN